MGTTTNQMGIGFHVCNVAGVTQGIYMSSYTAAMARSQMGAGTELFMSGKLCACVLWEGWVNGCSVTLLRLILTFFLFFNPRSPYIHLQLVSSRTCASSATVTSAPVSSPARGESALSGGHNHAVHSTPIPPFAVPLPPHSNQIYVNRGAGVFIRNRQAARVLIDWRTTRNVYTISGVCIMRFCCSCRSTSSSTVLFLVVDLHHH
jgi:hypothetical protein